jgi:hypothetical protein
MCNEPAVAYITIVEQYLKGAKRSYVNLKHDTQNSEPRMEPGIVRIKGRSATI